MSARNNVPLAIFLFIGAVSLNSIKDGISKLLSAEITPVTFLSIQYMFLVVIFKHTLQFMKMKVAKRITNMVLLVMTC